MANWAAAITIVTCSSATILADGQNDNDSVKGERGTLSADLFASDFAPQLMPQGGNNGTTCPNPVGPDLIVGEVGPPCNYDVVGSIDAFSLGTTACNAGDFNVPWIALDTDHPVIAQNLYRLSSGRFEQIGQSWVRHGFTAVTQNACGCGCNGQGGTVLGVGCSNPGTCVENGRQGTIGSMPGAGGLGPRSEVNAFTGEFPFPYAFQGDTGDSIFKRLQVHVDDLDPALNAGALYYGEAQYISADDAQSGNGDNNCSYRQMTVAAGSMSEGYNLTETSVTVREQPAIYAWPASDPAVSLTEIRVPNEGLIILAGKATYVGTGRWHYEYALFNKNSHRSVGSFAVPYPDGASVTSIGFHDVDYHSGKPYDLTDWTATLASNEVAWETDDYATNADANALRWSTLYNFRFDVGAPPISDASLVIGLFRPGSPDSITAAFLGPATEVPDCQSNGIDDSLELAEGSSADCNFNGTPDECEVPPIGSTSADCNGDLIPDACQLGSNDCNTNGIPDDCDVASETSIDCNTNGVPDDCELASAERVKLLASDAQAGDYFGEGVSISGDTAVVGATYMVHLSGPATGAAYVFVRDGDGWTQQQRLVSADAEVGDCFGCSVGISGDTLIVGAPGDGDGGPSSGAVYVFTRTGPPPSGSWVQQAKLVATDAAAGDYFGISVAIDGDTCVIGAHADDLAAFDEGSAYVFFRNGGFWTQQAKLVAPDAPTAANFAGRVAISGDTVIAGHPNRNSVGAAYAFVRSAGTWALQGILVPADAVSGDSVGSGVAISGDTLIVGAEHDDDSGLSSGSAYVYLRSAGVWAEAAKLTAADAAQNDFFGADVAVAGNTAVIGAYGDDDAGSLSGSAYFFVRSDPGASVWTQQAKLIASDGAANDGFGYSVAIDGNAAIIGANRTDDAGGDSGSAYVFQAPTRTDCNNNGIPDECDLSAGTAEDCNSNGVSDLCELMSSAGADCNNNNNPDECDIAVTLSTDCNTNAVPDECEIAAGTSSDCNLSGVPDDCEVAAGTSDDSNTNNTPDECEDQACCFALQPEICEYLDGVSCIGSGGRPQGLGTNCGPEACPLYIINEIRVSQPGSDLDEYFELVGRPGEPFDLVTYLVIGDGPNGSGEIEAAIDLNNQAMPLDGRFLAAEATNTMAPGLVDYMVDLNFENSDNVTHMLVVDFSGYVGQDLDTNDDCVLDVQPWTDVLDQVALVAAPNGLSGPAPGNECHYGDTIVGPDDTYSPGHVLRLPDASGDWNIGPFDPSVGYDTPGEINVIVPVRGACCFGAACLPDLTADECAAFGGVFKGALTTCTPNPCVGACCNNGSCSDGSTEEDCANQESPSFYRGGGTTCDACPCAGVESVVINEVWANDPGLDDVEFIEVFGPPLTCLSGLSLIIVDGDTTGDTASLSYRDVNYRFDFSAGDALDTNGFFVIGTPNVPDVDRLIAANTIQNGSQTYALVRTQHIAYCVEDAQNPGNPVAGCSAINNDKLTDGSAAAIQTYLIDAIATADTSSGDHAYFGAPVIHDDGLPADYLQRIPNGADTDSTNDWETQYGLEFGDPGDAATPAVVNMVGRGACCTHAQPSCRENRTRTQCRSVNGVYKGNGVPCTPDPCEGACCLVEQCIPGESQPSCEADLGGSYLGDGSACGQTECECNSILDARAAGPNAGLILCDVVVQSATDVNGSDQLKSFQLQDNSGAITVVGPNAVIDDVLQTGGGLEIGRRIDIAGRTNQFNGLFELSDGFPGLKIHTLGALGGAYAPTVLGTSDLASGSATAEDFESQLVTLECVTFLDGGGFFIAGENYLITDGMVAAVVRIAAQELDLVGTAIPLTPVTVTGVLSQADPVPPTDTPPLNSGYRLLPRGLADLSLCACACGDVDGSGASVDLQDYASFFECIGLTGPAGVCTPHHFACSDLHPDNSIDLHDFASFTRLFDMESGNSPPNCP